MDENPVLEKKSFKFVGGITNKAIGMETKSITNKAGKMRLALRS